MRGVKPISTLAAALALSACATTPGGQRLAERDPLEKFNRAVWDVNMAVDKVTVKPAAKAYNAVVPSPARRGVRNVFNNAGEPLSFINALLQGRVGQAFHTLGRFIVNTTIGVGGLADHASKMGLEEKKADLGQTFALWGMNAGPYLVLPFLGPSTLRDGVGRGVEFFGDPVKIAIDEYSGLSSTAKLGITGLQILDLRAELLEIGADRFLETSLDPYASARTAYLQQRQAFITGEGENTGVPDAADFDMGTDSGGTGNGAPTSQPSTPGNTQNVDPQDFEPVPAPAPSGTQATPPEQPSNEKP